MKTALIYHPIFLQHDTGPNHPERPSRVTSILRRLQKMEPTRPKGQGSCGRNTERPKRIRGLKATVLGRECTKLIDKFALIEPEPASIEDIATVHARDYILDIRDRFPSPQRGEGRPPAKGGVRGNIFLDPDTVISKDSFEAALFAAGAVKKGIDLIFSGEIDNAFCLVRPPGHHARPTHAMGFCIFNNVAIGAKYILRQYKLSRIMIIDWDVHHGNGTEEIFYEDDSVFYISLHQYPHYPGTGAKEDIGRGRGEGFNLNIPIEAGSGDTEYIKAFQELIIPTAKRFKPEFILISAGFDGHRDDPLSSINLTEAGYKEMTELTREIAANYANNRLVSVLEGGYNLISLPKAVEQHLLAL